MDAIVQLEYGTPCCSSFPTDDLEERKGNRSRRLGLLKIDRGIVEYEACSGSPKQMFSTIILCNL